MSFAWWDNMQISAASFVCAMQIIPNSSLHHIEITVFAYSWNNVSQHEDDHLFIDPSFKQQTFCG